MSNLRKSRFVLLALITISVLVWFYRAPGRSAVAQEPLRIRGQAVRQLEALANEKLSRNPAQQKIDSQLLLSLKRARRDPVVAGLGEMKLSVEIESGGTVVVDIKADVTPSLLSRIASLGGVVIGSYPEFRAITARLPLVELEAVAEASEVNWIRPADQATTNGTSSTNKPRPPVTREQRLAHIREQLTRALPALSRTGTPATSNSALVGNATSEGDVAHKADLVRSVGFDGTGIRIGVISDSYNNKGGAATDVANGDLPGPGNPLGNTAAVTVLQDLPTKGTDEGRAMLHLVHDLAPGAQLFFATGSISLPGMAANIVALQANPNNCQIIIDDLTYYSEGVFQDDAISQAVTTVTTAGALYFSSAGNSGNANDGTSGVWEGDFVNGGATAAPLPLGGTVHDFGGGVTNNLLSQTGGGTRPVTLKWSDPLNASNNDYDLYILNGTLTTVIASSTNTQSGTQDPYESIFNPDPPAAPIFTAGNRIVILRNAGAAVRALHLNSNRGRLGTSTSGQTFGHNAAANAFCVAAVDVATAGGAAFTGGFSNPVETYSSDGLRRMFYTPAGAAITPGNILFGTNGGLVLQKPDIAAADRAATNVPGFITFGGTSAAAPHAGAVAALVWSSNTGLTAAQVRTAITSTALDIEAAGTDRDSGVGIVMALEALASITPISDLAITKTASPDPVTTGSNITFTLNVFNRGPSTATSVVITDNLPTGTSFVSCSATGGGVCGGAGNNRTVTFASIAKDVSVTATIIAKANCDVANATPILNTASVASANPDPIDTNDSSSAGTTILNPPPVITCPANIDAFTDPGQLFATINPGTPVVSDAGTCPVVVTATRSDGQPVGSPYPVGTTLITWKVTDAANQTAQCVQTVKIRTLADMRVIIDPLTNPMKVGKFVLYRVEVVNDGPSPALGVRLTDKIANDQFFVDVTTGPGGGSCSYDPPTRVLTCDFGQVNHNSAKYVLLRVKPMFTGLTSNQATVSVDTVLTLDPNLINNSFTKYSTVVP